MGYKVLPDIARLECLLEDLRRLREDKFESIELGPGLPLLIDFKVTTRSEPCLEGTVFGHPKLCDGKTIITSGVHAYLEFKGQFYVRTLSRWYCVDRSLRPRLDG